MKTTIVTHGPSIAVELAGQPQIEVARIGKRLFKRSIVAVGGCRHQSDRTDIRTDLYFLGVCSRHQHRRFRGSVRQAHALRRRAANRGLASPEKLDTTSPFQIAPLSRVDRIVVNRDTRINLALQTIRNCGQLGVIARRMVSNGVANSGNNEGGKRK